MLRTLVFGAAIMSGVPAAAFDLSADISMAPTETAVGFLSADRLSEGQLARTTPETEPWLPAATEMPAFVSTSWLAPPAPYISSGLTMPEQFDTWNFDVATLLIAQAVAASGVPQI